MKNVALNLNRVETLKQNVIFPQRGNGIGSITPHDNTLPASIPHLNYIQLHLRGMLILSNDLLAYLVFPCFTMRGTQSKSLHKMGL